MVKKQEELVNDLSSFLVNMGFSRANRKINKIDEVGFQAVLWHMR